ncbi:FecR family protein [Flavivirga eckloniae]|uniref:FecR family protein n=1 Tax=Flavivirga eckloniae TaxID=1803846 RepID=UPI0013157115|nr:FecR family protein [Flavivirga eckloniae]
MKHLIYKFLSNTITHVELEELRKWLKNKDNKKTFNAHVRDLYAINMLYNNAIDVDKALKNVLMNISKPTKVTPLYKRSIFKYAAAILIFVSAGYFFLIKDNPLIKGPTIVNNNIEIGTDKAILTLDDGSMVALEKGKTYVADNIISNGEEITYNSTTTSKPEVAYNYLTVPRGGQYHIKLSDGTAVWLNSESKLKYPVTFNEGKTRQVELVYGEAYFDVSASTNHKGSKFKVQTGIQEVEVLGTEFNIKAYNDEDAIYTTLVEGKVSVKNTFNVNVLNPNQQSIINIGTGLVQINDIEVKTVIGWVQGQFVFKRKSLKDIMKILSRWYDVDVVFTNKELENVIFTGTLYKKQNIEEILLLIKNTNFINTYRINNKTIVLN